MKRKKRILMCGCMTGALAVILAGMLAWNLSGPGRYRDVREVAEDEDGRVTIGDVTYSFAGPVGDDAKRGSLLGYAKDEDGYITEYYEVRDREGELVIAWRRTLMGDRWMLRAE